MQTSNPINDITQTEAERLLSGSWNAGGMQMTFEQSGEGGGKVISYMPGASRPASGMNYSLKKDVAGWKLNLLFNGTERSYIIKVLTCEHLEIADSSGISMIFRREAVNPEY